MRRLLLAAVVLATALAAVPAAARAVPVTAVTFTFYDNTLGPVSALYTSANARITAGAAPDHSSVGLTIAQPGSDPKQIDFWAPPGEQLGVRAYPDAVFGAGGRPPGRAGFLVDTGCRSYAGQFDIKSLALAPDGTVQRLWAVYEQDCWDDSAGAVGEIRFNMPAGGPATAIPALVRWPGVPAGALEPAIPVTVVATRATRRLGPATIAGRDRGAFGIVRDDCEGRRLPAAGVCQVLVRARTRVGLQSALLRVPHATRVHLEAPGQAGRTQLTVHSEPGDPIGLGRDATLTPADVSLWWVRPLGNRAWFNLHRPDGTVWTVVFGVPPDAPPLARGHYDAGDQLAGRPWFEVAPPYDQCNAQLHGTFDVVSIAYAPAGTISSLAVSFVMQCGDAPGALRGTFEYRA